MGWVRGGGMQAGGLNAVVVTESSAGGLHGASAVLFVLGWCWDSVGMMLGWCWDSVGMIGHKCAPMSACVCGEWVRGWAGEWMDGHSFTQTRSFLIALADGSTAPPHSLTHSLAPTQTHPLPATRSHRLTSPIMNGNAATEVREGKINLSVCRRGRGPQMGRIQGQARCWCFCHQAPAACTGAGGVGLTNRSLNQQPEDTKKPLLKPGMLLGAHPCQTLPPRKLDKLSSARAGVGRGGWVGGPS